MKTLATVLFAATQLHAVKLARSRCDVNACFQFVVSLHFNFKLAKALVVYFYSCLALDIKRKCKAFCFVCSLLASFDSGRFYFTHCYGLANSLTEGRVSENMDETFQNNSKSNNCHLIYLKTLRAITKLTCDFVSDSRKLT